MTHAEGELFLVCAHNHSRDHRNATKGFVLSETDDNNDDDDDDDGDGVDVDGGDVDVDDVDVDGG
jgi:hypothetical protein